MALFGQPRLVLPGDVVMTPEDVQVLIAFVVQVRDLRLAQKRYFASHVPTAARRDLLVAARKLAVAVDKATARILAWYGEE